MIDEYSFGRIVINKKEYTHDVIILEGKIIDWWREEGHLCQLKDLSDIPGSAEILVIGTGASGMMKVDSKVMDYFRQKRIKVIAEMTGDAVNTFNKLKGQNKKVAAALHLTC
jgi:hypothetical protein